MSAWTMSEAQREAYETKTVQRMVFGVWRCPSGEVLCAEGMCCDDCGCCENADLWEAPMDWEPVCGHCGHNALLVEVVG
jgi:hypothetical protein